MVNIIGVGQDMVGTNHTPNPGGRKAWCNHQCFKVPSKTLSQASQGPSIVYIPKCQVQPSLIDVEVSKVDQRYNSLCGIRRVWVYIVQNLTSRSLRT
jgi:hypothetical protein